MLALGAAGGSGGRRVFLGIRGLDGLAHRLQVVRLAADALVDVGQLADRQERMRPDRKEKAGKKGREEGEGPSKSKQEILACLGVRLTSAAEVKTLTNKRT